MKTYIVKKGIVASMLLLGLTGSAFAGILGTTANKPGKFYVGVFGGGGSTNSFEASQFGTAFYLEEVGGPLAVNGFGDTNSRSTWFFGVQTGYQVAPINMSNCWGLAPALELEGYYLGSTTFTGDLMNDTSRLPEHDFSIDYPMTRTVFLANAVFNFNTPYVQLHPYFGVGFGPAIVRISGADAFQVSPPEVGVNHYNANVSDTDTTVAAQVKAGLSYDINECVNIFAEYRGLYLAETHFLFGSTVYPAHPATSPWQVKLHQQYTNLGSVGIKFNL